ncbi:MAG: radical SAM protein [Polyangiaceae bacterium]
MKVVLINPNREQMPWPTVPSGLAIVASALAAEGHTVSLVDLTFSKDPRRDLRRALRSQSPELVGVTIRNLDNCNFEEPVFYLPAIRDDVITTVRATCPGVPVVIGGSGVNVAPRETLAFLGADYALVGDGEESMVAFTEAIESGRSLASVPGLLSRDEAPAPRAPAVPRAEVKDFRCSVRSHAHRWVDLGRYAALGAPYPIQTKRGCTQSCSYCVYSRVEGRAFRLRDPREVADEIEFVVRTYGVKRVDFVDSTFNLPLGHAIAVSDELARRALPVELSTMGLNPAAITAPLLSSMRRAGFANVMCTPESASELTLATLGKAFSKKEVIRAAEVLREARMPTYWFFMFGAPGETMETVFETLAFCEKHIPPTDMVLFTTGIRVYEGTALAAHCRETGWFEASDSLFEPSWYVSPTLDLHEFYRVLVDAVLTHPNWMTNAETVVDPKRAALMKRVFQLLGWRGAFWQHLPKVFRWAHRARARGLEERLQRLGEITDIAHRRAQRRASPANSSAM